MYSLLTDKPWSAQARCTEVDPDIFYPESGGIDQAAAAKKVCRGCPVKIECLQYALDTADPYGVWGEMSAFERRRLRKRKVA